MVYIIINTKVDTPGTHTYTYIHTQSLHTHTHKYYLLWRAYQVLGPKNSKK